MDPQKAGHVYVIRESRTGLYKIGTTKNLERRLKQLGVGKTAALVESVYTQNAPGVERESHRRYRADRIPQTEYFKLPKPPLLALSLISSPPTKRGRSQRRSNAKARSAAPNIRPSQLPYSKRDRGTIGWEFSRTIARYEKGLIPVCLLFKFKEVIGSLSKEDASRLKNALKWARQSGSENGMKS